MTDAITPNEPSSRKKNLTRIFFGFILIFLSVFSAGVALYWPQLQKQFFPEMAMAVPVEKRIVPAPAPAVSAPEVKEVAAVEKKSVPREGFLWVDPASSPQGGPSGQYMVTLGKAQGVLDGRKLKVYDGTDLLGQVVVDRAMETVSYVVADKSMDIPKDAYYRVVAE